jgi:hypothetical protein
MNFVIADPDIPLSFKLYNIGIYFVELESRMLLISRNAFLNFCGSYLNVNIPYVEEFYQNHGGNLGRRVVWKFHILAVASEYSLTFIIDNIELFKQT